MGNKAINELLEKMLNNHDDIRQFYNQNIKKIESVSPDEIFSAMQQLLGMGKTENEVVSIVDKTINILYKQISAFPRPAPTKASFIFYLIEENRALIKKLASFKPILKKGELCLIRTQGLSLLEELKSYNVHMLKLENILFPAMEKKQDIFLGLSIMWALHDGIRALMKQAKKIFEDDSSELYAINKTIGQLYFMYYGLTQKQELLMFPAAEKWLNEDELESLHIQSFDYGFVYIDAPKSLVKKDNTDKIYQNTLYVSSTGSLNLEQISAVFKNLPLDLTVIDDNDEVVYFSDNSERIFPRSPAVIGRKVQNCHPPKSLAMVEEILKSFKENKKDEEVFWINLNEKIIFIKYFALRNEAGEYLGVLEVTQDITNIKRLEGEKRLIS